MPAAGVAARTLDVPALIHAARAGSSRAVARLVSLVEGGHPKLREVMAALMPLTGRAHVVGLTGPPGVGKSTSTTAVVTAWRRRGHRVGVLAIDPSSPFSGGALLGDRVRMQSLTLDPGVYIRSMASRGHLGGLSAATPQAIRVLDASGCDIVVVETVGVGQSEVEIAGLADTSVVLVAPGAGDGIQAAKAGILEIGDVFVVNKADRAGADATVRELRQLVSFGVTPPPADAAGRPAWRPPVLRTVATEGKGVDELVEAIEAHRVFAGSTGGLAERRQRRAAHEIEQLALGQLRSRFAVGDADGVAVLARLVVRGELDPYAAADRLVERLGQA